MQYVTIFELAPNIWIGLIPFWPAVIILPIGILVGLRGSRSKEDKLGLEPIGMILTIGSVMCIVLFGGNHVWKHGELLRNYKGGKFEQTDGVVLDIAPYGNGGSSFVVQDKKFTFSPSSSMNNLIEKGQITNGDNVRIAHSSNEILKLELLR